MSSTFSIDAAAATLGITRREALNMDQYDLRKRLEIAEQAGKLRMDQPTQELDLGRVRVDVWVDLTPAAEQLPFVDELAAVAGEIMTMLIEKNRKYGDSALNPKRVLSKVPPSAAIRIRMDDKIKRLETAAGDDAEDALKDFVGYYFLLRIAEQREAASA